MSEAKWGETGISQRMKEELEIYLKLKPYIGHCLILNHEVNNALSGIIGYAEVLMAEADNLRPEQRAHLEEILASAERVRELVERLCDERLALSEDIDLNRVTEAYLEVARELD